MMLKTANIFLRACVLFVVIETMISFSHGNITYADEKNDEQVIDYVVTFKERLSSILYKFGIGRKDSVYRLYGRDGWLERTKKANPTVDQWDNIPPGTRIKLILPAAIHFTRSKSGEPFNSLTPALPPENLPVYQAPPKNTPKETTVHVISSKYVRDDLSYVDVTEVTQAGGFLRARVKTDDGTDTAVDMVSLFNRVHVGPYLSGELRVESSVNNPEVKTKEPLEKPVKLSYRKYTVLGTISIPFETVEWQLRGGLQKFTLGLPSRLLQRDNKEVEAQRLPSSITPVAGLRVESSFGKRFKINFEGLLAKWKEADERSVQLGMKLYLLPTWFVELSGSYHTYSQQTLLYPDAKISMYGVSVGFQVPGQ